MSIVAHQTPSGKSPDQGTVYQQRREALRQDIMTTITPTVVGTFEDALEEEVTTYTGRRKGQHRAGLQAAASPLVCAVCSRHATLDFVRNGHYERTLLTLWGSLDLSVPRVECVCGHCPALPPVLFDRYDRLWSDLDAAIIQYTALALSLRSVSAVLELQSGQVVSIGTVQRRIAGAAILATQTLSQPLASVPPVIMVDGLWGTFMAKTGDRKLDKRGRLRQVKHKQKVPLLVAYGIDPTTGEKQVLAWVQGTAEDAGSWERLLNLLYKRGVHYDRGLRLLIYDGSSGLDAALDLVDFGAVRRQRCIFHKLRNVVKDVLGTEEMTRPEKRERVQAVLADACAVYEAANAEQARQRAMAFRLKWSALEPKAVATLERDFELTLTYYAVIAEAQAGGEAWLQIYLRATSSLERFNRDLRTKWRQAGAYWSAEGMQGAFWLVTQKRADHDQTTRIGWIAPIVAQLLEAG
jgi:transposase-like protein